MRSDEYWKDAVKLSETVGATEAAKQLGIHTSQIYTWRNKIRVKESRSDGKRRTVHIHAHGPITWRSMVALGGWIGGVPAIDFVGRDVPRQQHFDVLGYFGIGYFAEQDTEISLWMVAVNFSGLCRMRHRAVSNKL